MFAGDVEPKRMSPYYATGVMELCPHRNENACMRLFPSCMPLHAGSVADGCALVPLGIPVMIGPGDSKSLQAADTALSDPASDPGFKVRSANGGVRA